MQEDHTLSSKEAEQSVENEARLMEDNDIDDEIENVNDKYIQKLRKQSINCKLRATENLKELEKQRQINKSLDEYAKKSELAIQQVAEMKSKAEKRLIAAEIKSIAAELGLKKLEYAKLTDQSKIKVLENDEVSGVREALLELKNSDPDLFKDLTTTNTLFTSPKNGDNIENKEVFKDYSLQDYEKKKRDFLKTIR